MEDQQKYLYVLFSATPYRMGRFIRAVTGDEYNHVAIATEEDLSNLYAFARRFYVTPFYGGFVREHPCRYRHKGQISDTKLYRIPLTRRQWDKLQEMLFSMRKEADRYLYNHLSALLAPLHIKVRVRKAFTCAEFAVSVLSSLGFDFDTRHFYTIGDISDRLESYHFYSGKFPVIGNEDAAFFHPHPVEHPLIVSTRDLLRLFWRRHLMQRY